MFSFFEIPKLTRGRMAFALAVALVVDAIQIGLGPLGALTFLDDTMDFAAMGLIVWAVGFHPLLLPTLILELVPFVDMLPTWTGCTVAVLMLRKRGEENLPPKQYSPGTPPKEKPAKVLHDDPVPPR
jgi:hypothetical protein